MREIYGFMKHIGSILQQLELGSVAYNRKPKVKMVQAYKCITSCKRRINTDILALIWCLHENKEPDSFYLSVLLSGVLVSVLSHFVPESCCNCSYHDNSSPQEGRGKKCQRVYFPVEQAGNSRKTPWLFCTTFHLTSLQSDQSDLNPRQLQRSLESTLFTPVSHVLSLQNN